MTSLFPDKATSALVFLLCLIYARRNDGDVFAVVRIALQMQWKNNLALYH